MVDDVLTVIVEINNGGARRLETRTPENAAALAFVDVNDDGFLTALDSLTVIVFINSQANGEGESEEQEETLSDNPRDDDSMFWSVAADIAARQKERTTRERLFGRWV